MSNFKSGFVTIIGNTNVGKSSLINKIIREKVSAVTAKVQTTRKNVKAILNRKDSQIIFIDTPGIHKPKSKLGRTMIESAIGTIPDVDVVVYMIDATEKKVDTDIIEKFKESKKKIILAINKIDLVDATRIAELINQYKELYDFKAIVPICVHNSKNVEELIQEIESNLDEGPAYYDKEEYTDQTLREVAEEIIREKALKLLQEEVPHGILVEVTKMKTRKTKQNEKIYDVNATIYCLRESHKGIIIGKAGTMLKKIGTYSREDLEKALDSKVNLQLWVKVKEDWINNDTFVKKFKSKD